MSNFPSWVLDIECGSHIFTNVEELRRIRTLAKGEVDLRVGNGAKVVALALGTYVLTLPLGLILELNNFYFVSSIFRNIICISCLDQENFNIIIYNKSCTIFF